MAFTALDWFILIVLAGGLVRGLMVGAVRQVASLAGLAVAFLFSVQLMHPVGGAIVQYLGFAPEVAPVVGFLVLFVGIQVVFLALSRLVEQVLETLSLTLLNRTAGGALGGVKAALLLSVLFFVLSSMKVPSAETKRESLLYGPVVSALPYAMEVASDYVPAVRRASRTFGRRVRPFARSDSGEEGSE